MPFDSRSGHPVPRRGVTGSASRRVAGIACAGALIGALSLAGQGQARSIADRAAKCQAAKGANQQDGDTCQNDFRVDVAGATDHAVWGYMKRDGVKITSYMFYFVELVSGRLLQMTNSDKTRTFAAIHQHAGRLYIHEATVPSGMPEPILFMQSLGWADDKGLAIRYRTIYTEGYGEWKFPHEPPPFTVRDLNTSIDGTVVRPPR